MYCVQEKYRRGFDSMDKQYKIVLKHPPLPTIAFVLLVAATVFSGAFTANACCAWMTDPNTAGRMFTKATLSCRMIQRQQHRNYSRQSNAPTQSATCSTVIVAPSGLQLSFLSYPPSKSPNLPVAINTPFRNSSSSNFRISYRNRNNFIRYDGLHRRSGHQMQRWSAVDTALSFSTMDWDRDGAVTTTDDDESSITKNESTNKTMSSVWNIPGLKKELHRRIQRAHKKVGQYHRRIQRCNNGTNVGIENEDIGIITSELLFVQNTLQQLNLLEELISTSLGSKRSDMVLPEHIARLAVELEISDAPPDRPPRGDYKKKGPRTTKVEPRQPYRKYISCDNIEIRVGKRAEDNDELSTNPLYRDGSDWWLHAVGCPGSHVVIRHDNPPEATILDAAALAARQSKCNGSTIQVSLTRCRDVKKPPMTKAGLVVLIGNVRTVTVNMKQAESRLLRLETTVIIN
jgi:hypothetical protein